MAHADRRAGARGRLLRRLARRRLPAVEPLETPEPSGAGFGTPFGV